MYVLLQTSQFSPGQRPSESESASSIDRLGGRGQSELVKVGPLAKPPAGLPTEI